MATVTVKVWSSLSQYFGEERTVSRLIELQIEDGMTLEAFLRRLGERYPKFGALMFDPATGEPSDQVSVVVNGSLPELAEGYQMKLHDDDQVALVQAYAGGSRP